MRFQLICESSGSYYRFSNNSDAPSPRDGLIIMAAARNMIYLPKLDNYYQLYPAYAQSSYRSAEYENYTTYLNKADVLILFASLVLL